MKGLGDDTQDEAVALLRWGGREGAGVGGVPELGFGLHEFDTDQATKEGARQA